MVMRHRKPGPLNLKELNVSTLTTASFPDSPLHHFQMPSNLSFRSIYSANTQLHQELTKETRNMGHGDCMVLTIDQRGHDFVFVGSKSVVNSHNHFKPGVAPKSSLDSISVPVGSTTWWASKTEQPFRNAS
jgi:hypothetical protein